VVREKRREPTNVRELITSVLTRRRQTMTSEIDWASIPVEELEMVCPTWEGSKVLAVINRGAKWIHPYVVLFETQGGTVDYYAAITREKITTIIRRKPKAFKYTRWANVYPDGVGWMYSTRHESDFNANRNRIACIEVVIEGKEGDGL
jgi:hypothetical protein